MLESMNDEPHPAPAGATPDAALSGDFLELLGSGERLEAVIFECLAAGMADGRVASLMAVAGWRNGFSCFAVGGTPASAPGKGQKAGAAPTSTLTADIARIRDAVRDLGGAEVITGLKDGRLVALVRHQGAATPEVTCTAVTAAFRADAPLCVGPMCQGVSGATDAVRGVLFSLAAAAGVPRLPRPMRTDDVLPERALLGDVSARRELIESVYASLNAAGGDDPTMLTVSTFLASGGSLETTAKELNVHPNTVRYRLKRAAESTGWDATNPREAYVLTTAITLGRIHQS